MAIIDIQSDNDLSAPAAGHAPTKQPTAPVPTGPRIAIVHDYLTQRGGAERVVLSLLEAFPGSRLITSVYNPESTFPEFQKYNIETSWLNKHAVFRKDPRKAIPLLPQVFSGLNIKDVDVVLVSSSGWAHGVTTEAPKIVYCHNPARWLYQREDYLAEPRPAVRAFLKLLTPRLRRWDKAAAASVTTYFANSRAVAGRIAKEYGIDAEVLPPAVTLNSGQELEPVLQLKPGFLLTVSRARGYKNTQVVCEALEGLEDERLVVVGGLPDGEWSHRLTGVTGVSDAQLRWLYAHCSGVVAASHEDFGLTPIEGNSFGKPAVCLRAGGFLDTLIEGVSGVFIDELTPTSVQQAIGKLRATTFSSETIVEHARVYGLATFRSTLASAIQAALPASEQDTVIDLTARQVIRLP